MSISFDSVPSTLRVPFTAVEFDPTMANQGPALLTYRGLIIGQKIASGTGTANTIVRCQSEAEAISIGGQGSQIHRQVRAWLAQNATTELWVGILADAGGGVTASGTLTVSGTATAAGTVHLYLGGQHIEVAVSSGDSAATVAAAIEAAIDDLPDLPVTAGVVSAVVTVTARNKGTEGNSFDMRCNFRPGEAFPAGISVAVVAMASGATNPTLTTLITAMGDNWYHVIAHPYTDATSLSAIETELASRFGPMRMIDGLAITSAAGTQGTLTTLGDGRNSPHSCIVAQPGKNPLTPPVEFAAAVAGAVALSGANDPAKPLHRITLNGVVAPAEADRFTLTELNLLTQDGIGISMVGGGDAVQTGTILTTYQENSGGAEDEAYRMANTMLTLMYLRYSFRNLWSTRYPRAKLANDGTKFGAGQVVVTPSRGRAEAVAWFRQMETLGLVEGIDQFKRDLVVERNGSDTNRLDFLLPPDLINQLIVTAAKIQFRL